jgi:hypothetical protein
MTALVMKADLAMVAAMTNDKTACDLLYRHWRDGTQLDSLPPALRPVSMDLWPGDFWRSVPLPMAATARWATI